MDSAMQELKGQRSQETAALAHIALELVYRYTAPVCVLYSLVIRKRVEWPVPIQIVEEYQRPFR